MFKIDDSLKYANIPRTVRFPEDLFARLNALARANNISFNLLVLQCCRYALEQMQPQDQN